MPGDLEVESHIVEKKIVFQVEMLPNPRNDPQTNRILKSAAVFFSWSGFCPPSGLSYNTDVNLSVNKLI